MNRILLFGKNGQLGWELQRTLMTLGEVNALDYPVVDLGKPETLREIIRTSKPQLIVNAAAYTNVDKAESEPDLARRINANAPGVLAEEALRLKAALIHYSTDYVFDGTKGTPYIETDVPNPLNVYGKTKLEGEKAIQALGGTYLIIRTSWLYSLRGNGFVTKVLRLAHEQKEMRIVDDQIGSPTWARMLAEATAQVIVQGKKDLIGYINCKRGLYHVAGRGACSRYEWAKEILDLDPNNAKQMVEKLLPAKSQDFQTEAERPFYSALDSSLFSSTFDIYIPIWKSWIALALASP